MSLPTYSIKSLYTPALAEGEGVGTAYEYFAKRLVLSRWLKQYPAPKTMLIAGLPEKYGCSLDFLQLAADFQCAVRVVDDRPAALEKLQNALTTVQQQGWLTTLQPTLQLVADLARLDELVDSFDLCICSEVLQRLPPDSRPAYANRLLELGTAVSIFTPNGDNPAHTHISGLSGLPLHALRALFHASRFTFHTSQFGYIDMPPFPPGITRSDEQRSQASSGKFEALAMWGLGYYARLEHFLPTAIRRKQSHIVYALLKRP